MSNLNTELWIEGYRVDLFDNFDGTTTYSIDNIKDISTISSDYSKSINIPGTATNKKLFNYLFDIKSSTNSTGSLPNIGANYDFRKRARAYLLQNQCLILSGYARLVNAITTDGNTTFTIQIYSELGSLISTLGDSKLEDLSQFASGAFDHQLTLGNIQASWNKDVPYLYPLIDYGETAYETVNGMSWVTKNLRPCLYAKQYWDLIWQSSSFGYSSNFIEGDFFANVICPYKDGEFKINGTYAGVEVFAEGLTLSSSMDYGTIFPTGGNYPFNVLAVGSTSSYNVSTQTFYPSASGFYQVNISCNYYYSMSCNASSAILKNTPFYFNIITEQYNQDGTFAIPPLVSQQISHAGKFEIIGTGGAFNSAVQFASSSVNLNLLTNQYVRVRVCATAQNPTATLYYTVPFGATKAGFVNLVLTDNPQLNIGFSQVNDGNTVEYLDFCLKNIQQADFVQSILRTFNLYPVPDKLRKNFFNIYTHDEYYSNPKIIDWTDKLDTSQEITITPVPELDSSILYFSFRPDKDYYNVLYSSLFGGYTYGSLQLNTGYQFAQNNLKDVLDSTIFSPTVPVQFPNTQYQCENSIEILVSQRNIISATGYNASSASLENNVTFTKARKGIQIYYWGKLYLIDTVINGSSFAVTDLTGSAVELTRPAGAVNGTYYATNDAFTYITTNVNTYPTIYDSKDQNATRSPISVNPRLLYYAGLTTGSNIVVQYTPAAVFSSSYLYYDSNYFFSASNYPYVSHLNDPISPTFDLLWEIPNSVFFSLQNQYPENNLFTEYWENTTLEITDPDAKLYQANLKLNSVDISNLDLSDNIFIDGTRFRINQIVDYVPDDALTTKVELLRYPNTLPPQPALINISVEQSLGSYFEGLTLNGTPLIYLSGSNFPISESETGFFATDQFGDTSTIDMELTYFGVYGDALITSDAPDGYFIGLDFPVGENTINNFDFSTAAGETSNLRFTKHFFENFNISVDANCSSSILNVKDGTGTDVFPYSGSAFILIHGQSGSFSGYNFGYSSSLASQSIEVFVSSLGSEEIKLRDDGLNNHFQTTTSGSNVPYTFVVPINGGTTSIEIMKPTSGSVEVINEFSTADITNVIGIAGFVFSGITGVGIASGSHSAFTGGITVVRTGTVVTGSAFACELLVNNEVKQRFQADSTSTYVFDSLTYSSNDSIQITLSTG